jgi:hypothetical protein
MTPYIYSYETFIMVITGVSGMELCNENTKYISTNSALMNGRSVY